MKVTSPEKFTRNKYASNIEDVNESQFDVLDVVINGENEIGVVLAIYDRGELRTDMFGNACESKIRLATLQEITDNRGDILPELLKEEV